MVFSEFVEIWLKDYGAVYKTESSLIRDRQVIRDHDLRHTFASNLATLGVPVIKIKELLGHTDLKTTMRCMHLAPDALAGTTEILVGEPCSRNTLRLVR